MLKNSRVRYFILILIVIALGITSRKLEGFPTFFGDSLYAIMVYFGLQMFFINVIIKKAALLALLFCFGIEFLQLYDGEWMLEIRRTTLGHYVLGQGFIWSDLIYYTLGVITAVYLDFRFLLRK